MDKDIFTNSPDDASAETKDQQDKAPTSAKALYDLGSMYENGRGVPQNDTEAVKWYLKAANQGDMDAWKILGELKQSTNIKHDD